MIITDRDLTLINAVKYVFLEASGLLCQFHIDKNVKAKCKTYVAPKEAWDQVMDAWDSVKDCPSQSKYEGCVKMFEIVCSPWEYFVEYVKNTQLIPHKECFVKSWTNKVMHLGKPTSNRYFTSYTCLTKCNTLKLMWTFFINRVESTH